MMNVVNLLHVVVFLPGDTVEAHLAHHLEGGFQAGKAFQGSVATHMLIAIKDHHAILVSDRNDGLRKVAVLPGIGRFLLGFHGKAINVFTAEALKGGNQVCADALGHETGMQIGFRICGPGSAVGAHGHTGHGLHAAGNHHVFPARANFHGRQIHGFQSGGAETVQGDARHFFIPVSGQRCRLGDIRTLVTHGGHAAHHNVVHLGGIQAVPLLQRMEHRGQQRDGFDAVK